MSVFHKQICDAFEKCSGSLSPMEENKELIYLPMLFNGDGQKRAAVLCVLREENDEIFALMTIRSNQLLRHPGIYKSNIVIVYTIDKHSGVITALYRSRKGLGTPVY